jgi:DNA polymerase I-like protein with 3'-5' exonuclease and polymerase domains
MHSGLFGSEFQLPNTVEKTKKIIDKIKTPKKPKVVVEKNIKSKKISVEDKIALITEKVNRVLDKQKNNIIVINNRKDLSDYITNAISNNILAIDTETNSSLDPLTAKLMGVCIYTPNNKMAYIPINHVDYKTGIKLFEQLTEQDIKEELSRIIEAQTLTIMHNAKFDFQILKMTCNIEIPCYWDTMIAAKLIDENELAGLKQQYILHIDPEQEKYSIEELFEKEEYAIFPPEVFALYAATDPYMTYKLYEWQKPIMENEDYKKVNTLFHGIEMPVIRVVAEMELSGIELDKNYAQRLSAKYHAKLDELDKKIANELLKYKDKIDSWRQTPEANSKPKKKSGEGNAKSKSEQLPDTINLGSPIQLAILLYDIIGIEQVSRESPRGTGENILEEIDLPLAKLILERRGLLKLLDAFIDSLPGKVNPVDGRVHGHFNQYGAATGRFSSSEPNLQQLPAANKEIRMMFKAREGHVLVGSDWSQQEPRLLSNYSKDEDMINAYKNGKDLYATIASSVYKNDYWDNMEFRKDGTPNPEGKKRRNACKTLLLGIMYGQGVTAVAESIGSSIQEAQSIIDDFYNSFPQVKKWMDETITFAKKTGYVEDVWGRRRRLPDILLPRFEINESKNSQEDGMFNPILGISNRLIENSRIVYYRNELFKTKNRKGVEELIQKASKEGIRIKNNGGFIAQAERQCVNARIQGGSATMTKIAMNKLFRDEELNKLGFKLLLTVHDELIGECPKENAEKVAQKLTSIMRTCIDDVSSVPFKCDADISERWYYNDYSSSLKQEYKKLVSAGLTSKDAFEVISSEHVEMTVEELKKIIII